MSIKTSADLTPAWLTAQLYQQWGLTQGSVQAIDLGATFKTTSASITPMTLTYTPDIPTDIPTKLIHKACQGDWYMSAFAEAIFYNDIAAKMENPAVPQCLYAETDAEALMGVLILSDVSTTHERLPWPCLPDRPTQQELEQIVDELLKFHVHWWQHPYLEQRLVQQQGGPLVMAHAATPEVVRIYVSELAGRYPHILANFGDEIPSAWKTICQKAIDAWPDLMINRIESGKGLTMIHGDFHLWNIYFSRILGAQRPLFLDWETFRRGIGVYDLAYLLISSDDVAFRRQWEALLLKRYHSGLLAARITDYAWDDCQHDYHLAVIANLFPPLMWERPEALQSAIVAVEDWDAATLLLNIQHNQ